MSPRKPRHRSARDHRRDRQAAARASRAAAGRCALYTQQLPFSGYERWMAPNKGAAPAGELPGRAAEVLAMVQALAPVYGGEMPLAGLWLEQQIRAGVLLLGVEDGAVKGVPLPDMATVLAETADCFPHRPDLDSEEWEVGRLLHELHAEGGFFLDDDHVIRLAALV